MVTESQYARLQARILMDKGDHAEMREKYHYYTSALTWLCRISKEEETVEDAENKEFCLEMANKYL